MNKNSLVKFSLTVLFLISTLVLAGCDRNEVDFAGVNEPRTQPDYTYSVEENRNK